MFSNWIMIYKCPNPVSQEQPIDANIQEIIRKSQYWQSKTREVIYRRGHIRTTPTAELTGDEDMGVFKERGTR